MFKCVTSKLTLRERQSILATNANAFKADAKAEYVAMMCDVDIPTDNSEVNGNEQ